MRLLRGLFQIMELHFIGTGSCYPSLQRGASCTVLRHQNGCWMFDCGEGSQTKLMKSPIKPGRITKIFITHLHGDHVFGLPGFLCTTGQNCPDDKPPIELYGPVGLRKFIRTCLEVSQSRLGYKYCVHELLLTESLKDTFGGELPDEIHTADNCLHPDELQGETVMEGKNGMWEVCREGNLYVQAAPLKHRTVCFGYIINEDEIPGKLDPGLLTEKGIPPGPLYARIKQGYSITAPDGTVVTPGEVIGPPRPGRKIVILGDTCDSSKLASAATNCDCLVHEATHEDKLEEKAIEFGHSTPGMAGQFAKNIQAKKLVLTHFSQRYRNPSDELVDNSDSPTLTKLLDEGKKAFKSDNIVAAEDFTVVNIPFRNMKMGH